MEFAIIEFEFVNVKLLLTCQTNGDGRSSRVITLIK